MFEFKSVQNMEVYSIEMILKYQYFHSHFQTGSIFSDSLHYVLDISVWKMIEELSKLIDAERVISCDIGEFVLLGKQIFMYLASKPTAKKKGHRTIYLYGPPALVEEYTQIIDRLYADKNLPSINWWYTNKGEAESTSLVVDTVNLIYDQMYPWIEGGVDKFCQDYLNDSAQLLFMMGPPGTGKTSLIRHLLARYNILGNVTYEEGLLKSDTMFMDFLGSNKPSCLIFEDSESVLIPREHGENPMMNRFLNISDGLIKKTDKKIIFTTNLQDEYKVDQALLRPGRCYELMKFRALSPKEQRTLQEVLPSVNVYDHDAVLADLFQKNSTPAFKRSVMGFV